MGGEQEEAEMEGLPAKAAFSPESCCVSRSLYLSLGSTTLALISANQPDGVPPVEWANGPVYYVLEALPVDTCEACLDVLAG